MQNFVEQQQSFVLKNTLCRRARERLSKCIVDRREAAQQHGAQTEADDCFKHAERAAADRTHREPRITDTYPVLVLETELA